MPKITQIKPQKRQGRVNIFLDGQFSFSLDLENLAKSGLKVDQEVSEKRIETIIKEGELTKTNSRLLNFLGFRPRSEKEIFFWFKRKEIGEQTQRLLLEKLKKQGFINDEEFARWWVEQRTNFRPQGLRAIKIELLQKGIERKLIEKIVNDLNIGPSQVELAERAALRKMKTLKNLSPQEKREKLFGFLRRRGFDWETIRKVLK